MTLSLALASLLVRDYDEAIAFFTEVLGFELVEDEAREAGKRWVVVASRGGGALLLARAANEEQQAQVGRQAGGRVAFFLDSDDFAGDYARLAAHGVRFTEQPRKEDYGDVVVFLDLYGNRWDLVGRHAP